VKQVQLGHHWTNSRCRKDPLEDGPIKGTTEEVKIPVKPKKTPVPEMDGNGDSVEVVPSNGTTATHNSILPAKRSHPDGPDDASAPKKAKSSADNDVVLIEDNDGAILID